MEEEGQPLSGRKVLLIIRPLQHRAIEGANFIAFGISFLNEAPTGVAYTSSQNQSVAAFVGADMVAFYHCAFFSIHNTFFDYKGRHYYDNCYIQGFIDSFFGRGRSMFHDCEIFVIDDKSCNNSWVHNSSDKKEQT
ncbi:hypothetical protein SLE2022_164550 [Rubroshorea leprosula]